MKKNSGFTLIELLISIAIVAIATIGGIFTIQNSRNIQLIKKTQKEITIGLNEAKDMALLGKKPDLCTIFNGYSFILNTIVSPITYSLVGNCNDVPEDKAIVKTYSFSNDIVITTSNPEVFFKSVTGQVDLASAVIFNITSGNKTSTLTIDKSGNIVAGSIN